MAKVSLKPFNSKVEVIEFYINLLEDLAAMTQGGCFTVGVLHGIRRGCAPVLGSVRPENSWIGYTFTGKFGHTFTWIFLGLGFTVYCYTQNSGNGCWMKVQLDDFLSNTCLVSVEQISSISCVEDQKLCFQQCIAGSEGVSI